jgi:hypothetical protein
MPHPYLYKLAHKHGISVDEAEKRWNKAKSRAKDEGKDKDWVYITGIFKRSMGEGASFVGDEEADTYDPVLPPGMQPNASVARLREVAAMANQAQAKRFLQGIGLQPTSVGMVEENYISYKIKDPGESKTVNIITQALGVAGVKQAKDYGPVVNRVTKTIQWIWRVPSRGVIKYFPSTHKVAFMNQELDDKGETV